MFCRPRSEGTWSYLLFGSGRQRRNQTSNSKRAHFISLGDFNADALKTTAIENLGKVLGLSGSCLKNVVKFNGKSLLRTVQSSSALLTFISILGRYE